MTRLLYGCVALGLLLCGCSEDQERFVSQPPRFSGIRITNLQGEEITPRVGEPFVATAQQTHLGKLLNTSRYQWSVENTAGWHHRFENLVVYDNYPENPRDTIIAQQSGRFFLQLKANYSVSGQASNKSLDGVLPDGTEITYHFSPLTISVTLRRELAID